MFTGLWWWGTIAPSWRLKKYPAACYETNEVSDGIFYYHLKTIPKIIRQLK
jgi:hypothetical protein